MRKKVFLLVAGLTGLTIAMLALLLRAIPHIARPACLLCVWLDLSPSVRTAISVITSTDAIGGAIFADAGERIGGSFGRGFGQSLGETIGSGKLVGLAMGGGSVISGAKGLGEFGMDQAMDQVKGAAQNKAIDYLFGDETTRNQEALDWLKKQIQ